MIWTKPAHPQKTTKTRSGNPDLLVLLFIVGLALSGCRNLPNVPSGVEFKLETLKRVGGYGDNWCHTWAKDGSQITTMDDGNWLGAAYDCHNNIYRIIGDQDHFEVQDIPGYPKFAAKGEGWFGYGICSVHGTIYSLVSRTPKGGWAGPFRGIKMLKSTDNGETWYRVNPKGETRLIKPWDEEAKEGVNSEEMFFLEEYGRTVHGQTAYPFSYCSFVERGRDYVAADDGYVYIHSPEGAQANRLLLARVRAEDLDFRDRWEYFSGWDGGKPAWTNDLAQREPVHVFPEKNDRNEYFGWYSWLPSVVWNPGLGLYIMVNGGTYGGLNLSDSAEDYYSDWMHTKSGSLGLWYSKNPYGPWTQFYYTDYWTVDNENNRTYQPKLSSKWMSEDGRRMVLVWSDAMKDAQGRSHTVNYKWNQMEIEITLKREER